jgi:hypothetical protein
MKTARSFYSSLPVVTKCGNMQKKAIQCDQCTQSYTSKEGFKCHKLTVQLFRKKEHQILHWHELCKLILKNPKKNVDAIIRGDLCRYTDQLSVLLRQNPHNVAEWLNRVKLFKQKEKPHEIINKYTEAVSKQIVGKLDHYTTAIANSATSQKNFVPRQG